MACITQVVLNSGASNSTIRLPPVSEVSIGFQSAVLMSASRSLISLSCGFSSALLSFGSSAFALSKVSTLLSSNTPCDFALIFIALP